MERNNIGGRIETLRKKKGLTQADLAKAMGVKRETVNQWESNTRDLKTDYTLKLSSYFETSCDYILNGHKAENSNIYQLTGLSDEAIETLKKLFKKNNIRAYSDILSIILEDENIEFFVSLIGGYFEVDQKDISYSTALTRIEVEHDILTLFAINETFRRMLERGKPKFLSRFETVDTRADRSLREMLKVEEMVRAYDK